MNKMRYILIIVAAVLLIALTGCNETSRRQEAEMKWQQKFDAARIETARLSIERGELAYAERVLEGCSVSEGRLSGDAQQMIARIRMHREMTQARSGSANAMEDQAY